MSSLGADRGEIPQPSIIVSPLRSPKFSGKSFAKASRWADPEKRSFRLHETSFGNETAHVATSWRSQNLPALAMKHLGSHATARPVFFSLLLSPQVNQPVGATTDSELHPLEEKSRNTFWRWEMGNRGSRKTAEAVGSREEAAESSTSDNNGTKSPMVCLEITKGRKKTYRESKRAEGGFETEQEAESSVQKLKGFFSGYLLPQGYPDSVAPQYSLYMGWRGVQYFFGGAMSVFTTRSLLTSLGVAGRRSGEAAAAINWVLKDGAGRLGRFLFARWGRALDCELKQFRLLGDILMESGAALELSTIAAPNWFLPLACTANLSKNLAAVAASSTRAPIYRTFALQNNLADVTAKGESVANLADILGTLTGIVLSRAQLPMGATFCALSAGYLIASRKEVDSVELPYYNRARLALATRLFFQSGTVPGVPHANHTEPLLPWGKDTGGRIVLGASISEAFDGPEGVKKATNAFLDKPYILTYKPSTKKVYAVLRQGATSTDVFEASFHSHFFLHLHSSHSKNSSAHLTQHVPSIKNPKNGNSWRRSLRRNKEVAVGEKDWSEILAESQTMMEGVFKEFKAQSSDLGWKLHATMLNPKENRLAFVQ
ncbi:hypothetical protein BSKO_08548 [Bryopsis sp. KO-2023]|nr:hypothetical protein BSKO_08548 [Bryopsis sp. KO-2023]